MPCELRRMFGSWFVLNTWQWLFLGLWVHRYLRLLINTLSHWLYRSVPIPVSPSYSSQDVTVVIPTIHHDFAELRDSILSILQCQPCQVLIVTTYDKYPKLLAFTQSLKAPNVRCFCSPIANKRLQLCVAIPRVTTAYTILADDDVTWPTTILPHLLAPFEDPRLGAVGPCQRVKRLVAGSLTSRIFNWLGAAYIERRNFEISATHAIDGGTSCMSGRTCAFRTEILQSADFMEAFKSERWGRYQLNADDDNFITRWLVNHGWSTWIQYNRECEIETTLENNGKFLYQCSRWARSNWRSNWTTLVTDRIVWRRQPYSTYAIYITTFTSLSFVFDPLILYLCYKATAPSLESTVNSKVFQPRLLMLQIIFMISTKVIKLLSLFLRQPSDLLFLPVSILFGYFHGFIKIYALLTLRMTSWGSRADGDANDSHRMSPRTRRSGSLSFVPLSSREYSHGLTLSPFRTRRARRKSSPAAYMTSTSNLGLHIIAPTQYLSKKSHSKPVAFRDEGYYSRESSDGEEDVLIDTQTHNHHDMGNAIAEKRDD